MARLRFLRRLALPGLAVVGMAALAAVASTLWPADGPRPVVAELEPGSAPSEVHTAADVHFATLPPGAPLPADDDCAALIQRTGWEPRPANHQSNQLASQIHPGGAVAGVESSRVTGAFAGTTDEILRWGACKWGFDEDTVRAVAAQESSWRQAMVGDGGLSFGIMQVKRTTHPGTFPQSRDSTAFNVDYALAWRRACYEGAFTWLNRAGKQGGYQGGDEWGCIGAWYSGDWYDEGAREYIQRVRLLYLTKPWMRPGF